MKLEQLAKDPAPMPKEVSTPAETTKKSTEDGTWLWSGATEYHQMKDKKDFAQPSAIKGHKQQKNVDPVFEENEIGSECKACGGSGENSKGGMCGACKGKGVRVPPNLKKK